MVISRTGYILAALWIFGGALFFFIRFTLVFYYANQSAINALLSRFFGGGAQP